MLWVGTSIPVSLNSRFYVVSAPQTECNKVQNIDNVLNFLHHIFRSQMIIDGSGIEMNMRRLQERGLTRSLRSWRRKVLNSPILDYIMNDIPT